MQALLLPNCHKIHDYVFALLVVSLSSNFCLFHKKGDCYGYSQIDSRRYSSTRRNYEQGSWNDYADRASNSAWLVAGSRFCAFPDIAGTRKMRSKSLRAIF
jgi:hypothetical protein